MNTTPNKRIGGMLSNPVVMTYLSVIALLIGHQTVLSQGTKKEKEKEVPSSGYLSKSPPAGLRFAAPPRPPVAYLLPLPITHDPQPVFTPEFAQPNSEAPVQAIVMPPPSPPAVTSVPLTELTSILTNKGKIPESFTPPEVVNPQMLVKFFRKTKQGYGQFKLPNPVSFHAPLTGEKPSSSATYEVK